MTFSRFAAPRRALSGRRDAGNAVVETAILAPLFIVFLAVLLTGMRIRHGDGVVTQAAADAARQASIARSAPQARIAAVSSALATLRRKGLHCDPQVTVDLSGFAVPAGRAATVTAQVRCTVQLRDVALPGMPGNHTVTAAHRSPIDPYRARALGDRP